jgi:hypothetical protein
MCDAPQSSLMDSTVSLKRKTTKREGVGVCFLAGNISGVDGCAGVPGWTRKINKQVNYSHKPSQTKQQVR